MNQSLICFYIPRFSGGFGARDYRQQQHPRGRPANQPAQFGTPMPYAAPGFYGGYGGSYGGAYQTGSAPATDWWGQS